MQGRKPKPMHLRAIDGNPGKRGMDEGAAQPSLMIEIIDPPDYMTAKGKECWHVLQPQLAKVIGLSSLDLMALEGLCEAYGRYHLAREALITPTPAGEMITTVYTTHGRNGKQIKTRPEYVHVHQEWQLMKMFMAELGMTPTARARLKGVGQLGLFDDDPLTKLRAKYGQGGQDQSA